MKIKSFFLSILLLVSIMIQAQINWVLQNPVFPSGFTTGTADFSLTNDNTIWAYSSNPINKTAGFSKSQNGGNFWTPSGEFVYGANLGYINFQAIDSNTAFVLFSGLPYSYPSSGRLKKTTDGGVTWIDAGIFSSFPNFVHFFDSDNGIVICDPASLTDNFLIYTTSNGGNSWQTVSQANLPPIVDEEYTVTGYCDYYQNNFWFATNSGRIFKTGNQGASWTAIQTPYTGLGQSSPSSLGYFSLKDNTNAFILDGIGNLQKTNNGGASWNFLTNLNIGSGFGIDIENIPNSNVIVATGISATKYSTDNGQTWIIIDNTLKYHPRSVDSNSVWATGNNGTLYKLDLADILNTHELSNPNNFQIAPNPAGDFILITSTKKESDYKITDAVGKTIIKRRIKPNEKIDIKSLKPGVYFIESNQFSGKFIKK